MTTNQDNFDELIRQKFAEKEFVFNEENWEKMESKIQTQRRLGKTALWSSIFGVGLVAGVGMMLLFTNVFNNHENSITENNNTIITNEQAISESNNKNSTETINNTNTTNTAIDEVVAENNNQNAVENENNATVKNNTIVTNNSSSNSVTKEESSNNSSSNSTANTSINSSSNTAAVIKQKNKNTNPSSKPQIESYTGAIKATSPTVTNNVVAKTNENTSTTIVANNTRTESKINQQKVEDVADNNVKSTSEIPAATNNLNAIDNKSEKTPITNTTSVNTEATTIEMTTATGAKNADGTNAITEEIAAELKNRDAGSEDVNMDSLVTKEDLAKDTKPTTSNAFRNNEANTTAPAPPGLGANGTSITAEAGTNYTFGWKYPEASEGRGFNAVVGIGLTHYFNPKFAINLGAQYGSIAYLKATKKTFSNTDYGFGSTTIDTTINTNYLHYIVVPLMVEYTINKKNSVLFGVSASYLINSKSKITINSSSVGPAPVGFDTTAINSASNNSVKGYYDGAFSKFDATVGIGYRRRLTTRFSVSAIANFGLIDVKKDDFFGINKVERNSGVKLIFTYNLFDLK